MKLYKYLFYQVYKFLKFTNIDFPYLITFKTLIVINIIGSGLLALIENKINEYFYPPMFLLEKWIYLSIICLPPLFFNYYIFGYQDKHKKIIAHFDKIDKKEKKKLNIQLLICVSFLIGLVTVLFAI